MIQIGQFNTLEIVKYHSNKILMTFFADLLSLGTGKSGSFALSDNKLSLLTLAIESHLKAIKRLLNHDLMRQIYSRNGWKYNPKTSCYFDHDDIDDGDLTEFSGAIQKIAAVGGFRHSKDTEKVILDKVFDLEPYNDKTEFIETENTSRSGDGMETGLSNGTGTSTSKGGNRSTGNSSKETA